MKTSDFLDEDDRYNVEKSDDDILFEMSNFGYQTTGLPTNITVWTRTDPLDHGHNRYRIKITKDNKPAGIFTVGSNPVLKKDIDNLLTNGEQSLIISWIKEYYPLIINHIDGKVDSGEFSNEVKRIRGTK